MTRPLESGVTTEKSVVYGAMTFHTNFNASPSRALVGV